MLGKAFARGLPPIVVINKIDRPDARAAEVLNEIFDLFIDLDASEAQLDFPVIYTNGRRGTATLDLATPGEDLRPLFDAIVEHVPPPMGSLDAPLQILVANLDSSDYLGRIAIGRIFNGRVKIGDEVAICSPSRPEARKAKITKLFSFDGLKRIDIDNAAAGDIVCLAGMPDITIGETITEIERQAPVPVIAVDEPTVSMIFGVNTSPMAGREGQYVTSRQVRDRLERELIGNVSIRLEDTDSPEADQGGRPRRAAAVDPDRDDAARRVRAAGLAARDRHQGGRTASGSSRSRTSSSTCRRIFRAWSSRRSAAARAR